MYTHTHTVPAVPQLQRDREDWGAKESVPWFVEFSSYWWKILPSFGIKCALQKSLPLVLTLPSVLQHGQGKAAFLRVFPQAQGLIPWPSDQWAHTWAHEELCLALNRWENGASNGKAANKLTGSPLSQDRNYTYSSVSSFWALCLIRAPRKCPPVCSWRGVLLFTQLSPSPPAASARVSRT